MKTILLTFVFISFSFFAQAGGPTSWTSGDAQFGKHRFTTSSTLASQAGNGYSPKNLFDGKPSTAWVEGVNGYGVNEWVQINFDGASVFQTILIMNGYPKNRSVYSKNSRIKGVRVNVAGQSFNLILQDNFMKTQSIKLPQKVKSDFVRLTITSVYPGSKYMDTCLAEFGVDLEEFNYQ